MTCPLANDPECTALRIIHVLNHTQKANGHVCAVVDLACAQVKRGHQVYVCSRGGDFDYLLYEHNVGHITINQDRRLATLLAAVYRLHRAIQKFEPDIIHAHMVTSALLVALLRPFMRFRLVTTVHNEFQSSAVLMGVANRVVAVSDLVRQSMIRRRLPASKLRTVLNGTVNSPRFPQPAPSGLSLKHPAIVFVGGLHPRKGIDDLIHAFGIVLAAQPNAQLYLIGDGPCRTEYEILARHISAAAIHFCGYVDDPRAYLLGADIFVLASHSDPAPLVISEARDAGCAIVATSVDGVPEMLDRGAAGILVPPKQPALLANGILELLLNPAYLAEMRNRSRSGISHFTVERVAAETEQVYRELLG